MLELKDGYAQVEIEGWQPENVDHFLANQWSSILKSMKRFVSMEKEEYDLLQMYLQYNAKDMQKEK